MANNLYTTKTAALKATKADISKLDVKKLLLGGENILDIIKRATPTIKHSQDTRETVTENDLWGQWVETKSDGTIIVHDDWVTNPNASNRSAWNKSINKVEDNKAYVNDTLYGNIQAEKIKDGSRMFYQCNKLTSFTSDLSSLENGYYMLSYCYNLETFSSDSSGSRMNLSNLTEAACMFQSCNKLTSFSSDLPSLLNGEEMFRSCGFESFTSGLTSLINGEGMFSDCSDLNSFTSVLPSLLNGEEMFARCKALTSFSTVISSLTNGDGMFVGCTNLTTFSSEMPSLSVGSSMFGGCTNLTTFSSDLSNMIDGHRMFNNC